MKTSPTINCQFRGCLAAPAALWLRTKRWLWIGLFLPRICGAATPADLDPTFDPGSTIDDSVTSIAIQGDGKVVIGGFFETVHGVLRSGLARLNTDGSTDATFPGELAGGYSKVSDLAVQSNGMILVAGSFSNINGVAQSSLVRLLGDGTVDDSWAVQLGGTSTAVGRLALQADGKVIISGSFTSVNGVARPGLARLNADGSLDESFLDGLSGPAGGNIFSLTILTSGQVVVAGSFGTFNGAARPYLVRLNDDGSLDPSFMDSVEPPDELVRAVGLQADGKIIIGGLFSQVGGTNQPGIARLNADGSVDESFSSAVRYIGPNTIAVCPDEKILIGGWLTWPGTSNAEGLARLNPDGSLDLSFVGSIPAWDDIGVRAMKLLVDGKILVSGGNRFSAIPPYLLRLNADGSLDPSYGNGPKGPDDPVQCLVLQSDGKVVIGGTFGILGNTRPQGLARLNADGSWDTNYATYLAGADRTVFSVVLDASEKCLVAGEFGEINGVAQRGIARLNLDGSVDGTFANILADDSGYAYALARQSDGKILVGGTFNSIDGVAQSSMARLNEDGTIDTSFRPLLGRVHTLAVQPDDKVVVGGYFTSVDGLPRKYLARLNTDGSVDTTFMNGMAGLSGSPSKITLQPDGKVLIGGWFETVNQVSCYGFARLNVDGSVDATFASICQANSTAWAIAVQGDGKILVGGYLRINGQVYHLVRLNTDGTFDETFSASDSQPNGEVLALAIQPDTRILAAGDFTIMGQTPCSRVARLMGPFVAPAFLRLPQSRTVETGSTTDFRVTAEGFPQVTYQWFFNGTNLLNGCTNASLRFADISPSDIGAYTIVISNAGGAVTSAPVMLGAVPPVERTIVPGLSLTGDLGSSLHLESTDELGNTPTWTPLATAVLDNSPQWWFDLAEAWPTQQFYRAWQSESPVVIPSLRLDLVPALTLTGDIGTVLRVDGINAIGPTDAWFTLDTVTLTNTSQLYFDVTAPGQSSRLYRLTPLP